MQAIFTEEVLTAYESGESIKNIITHYNLDVSVAKFSSMVPPLELEDERCPYCNNRLYLQKRKRVPISEKNPPKCLSCNHTTIGYCSCTGCKRVLQERIALKQKNDYEKYKIQYCSGTRNIFSSLPAEQKLFILAFIKSYSDEDLKFTRPIKDPILPLTSLPIADKALIEKMLESNLLLITGYKCDNHDDLHLEDLVCMPNISESIQEISGADKNIVFNEDDYKNLVVFEHNIKSLEIQRIMMQYLDEVNLRFYPGEKTVQLVKEMEKTYNLEKIAYLIHLAVKNSIYYIRQNPISKKHEYNLVVSNLERCFMKSVEESWSMEKSFLPRGFVFGSMRFVYNMIKVAKL